MAFQYVSKNQATAIITAATGYGRRIIDKAFDTLIEQGRIKLWQDFDGRTYHISREDVDVIIKYLKHEVE